jgi:hypothetical protein
VGAPAVQTSAVQPLPSTGTSPLSTAFVTPPAPSHSSAWQSPAICIETSCPAGVKPMSHAFAMHVRAWHSVSRPGQVSGERHSTHAPPPSQ